MTIKTSAWTIGDLLMITSLICSRIFNGLELSLVGVRDSDENCDADDDGVWVFIVTWDGSIVGGIRIPLGTDDIFGNGSSSSDDRDDTEAWRSGSWSIETAVDLELVAIVYKSLLTSKLQLLKPIDNVWLPDPIDHINFAVVKPLDQSVTKYSSKYNW